jgi:hypothetical protein
MLASLTDMHALTEVPVIAVFTKLDALDIKAFNTLIAKGKPIDKATQQTPALAASTFKKDYLKKLKKVKYHPSEVVQLRGNYTFANNTSYSFELLIQTCTSLSPTAMNSLNQLLKPLILKH